MKKFYIGKKKTFFLLVLFVFLFVLNFSYTQEPRTQKYNHYYFLLDTSGSMKETAPGANIPTKIKLQESLIKFIYQLEANTRASIYTFDKGIQKYMHFVIPDNRNEILDFINSLEFEGKKTYAWQSLDSVIQEAKKDYESNPDSIPIIMMLTDGKDETDWTLQQVLQPFQKLHRVNNDSQLLIITLNFELDTPPKDLPSGVSINAVPPSDPIPSPLTARFDWWPISPKAGEQVLFINRTSPIKDSYSYLWKFGDGTESNEAEPAKVFSNPGSFQISLKVKDDEREDSYQKTIGVGLDVSPVFAVSKRIGRAPLKVKIENQSSGKITDYLWDFGDGETSSDKDPLPYTYKNEGEYTISLNVKNKDTGEERTLKMTIIVESPFPWLIVYIIGGSALCIIIISGSILIYCKQPVPLLQIYDLNEVLTKSKKENIIQMGFGRRCKQRKNLILLPDNLVSVPSPRVATFERSNYEWESALELEYTHGQCKVMPNPGEVVYLMKNDGQNVLIDEESGLVVPENSILKVNEQPFVLRQDINDPQKWILTPGWTVQFKLGVQVIYQRNNTSLPLANREIILFPKDKICFESFSFVVDIERIKGHVVLTTEKETEEESVITTNDEL